jgi:hypothetical protein
MLHLPDGLTLLSFKNSSTFPSKTTVLEYTKENSTLAVLWYVFSDFHFQTDCDFDQNIIAYIWIRFSFLQC